MTDARVVPPSERGGQPGDRVVRRELRQVLRRYGLTTGDLFDRAYAYIRENY